MSNHHRRHDRDGHGHAGRADGHACLWLARAGSVGAVHRVGRRQFLTDLGRNTLAIAVLGGFAAGCSGDDDAATPDTDPDSTTATPTTVPSVGSTAASVPGAPSTSGPPEAAALRWAQASLGSVSAYVLVRGNEAAVVDTGNPGSTDAIGEALGTLGVTFDDVRHVVLTHSHPDHVGSLAGVLGAATAATPYAGALDIPNIASPMEVVAVGDGDDVFGLRVVSTPGHTPGSISVFDPGIGLLLAGDALNGTGDGTGLTGPNPRFTADMETAGTSVAKLATLPVDAVGMGHGEPVESGAGVLLAALAADA